MPVLKVTGESLAAVLEASLRSHVTLGDVMSHLQATHPAAHEELQTLRARLDAQQEAEAREAAAAQEAADAAAGAEAGGQCRAGLHLEASHASLLLSCPEGQEDMNQVQLSNRGSVAVVYEWRREAVAAHPVAAQGRATWGGGAGQPCPQIHVFQHEGVLLPGESVSCTLLFRPERAGEWLPSHNCPLWHALCSSWRCRSGSGLVGLY